MLFESINIWILNKIGKLTPNMSGKIKTLIVFACFIGIGLVFSLFPRNAYEGRRMTVLSFIVLIAITACTDGDVKPVKWNMLTEMALELFALSIIVIRAIHPVGQGYIVFAVDILFLFPMLYIVLLNNSYQETLIDLFSYAAIISGIICFTLSMIFAQGEGNYVINGRVMGLVNNPNYYGMIGLVLIISCLYNIARDHRNIGWRIVASISMGIGITMIKGAIARTAILSAGICVAIFLLFLFRKNRYYKRHNAEKLHISRNYLVLLIEIIIIILSAFASTKIQNSMFNSGLLDGKHHNTTSIILEVNAEDSTNESQEEHQRTIRDRLFANSDYNTYSSGRISIWEVYIKHMNITGNDLDAVKDEWFAGLGADKAHNNFLDYAFRFGIPTGILYLIFFFGILVRTAWLLFKKKIFKPEDLWLVMAVVSYSLYSIVEVASLPFTRYIPCLFFLSIGPLMGSPFAPDHEEYVIADGVKEDSLYMSDSDGNSVIVHVLRIIKNSNIRVIASCSEGVAEGIFELQSSLTYIANSFNDSHKGAEIVVAASSGDFFSMKTGKPCGALVMDGHLINDPGKRPFFAVRNDGKYIIRKGGSDIDDVTEAVGGRQTLLRNGKIKVEKGTDKHPRQAVGICKDNSLMIVNVEGRQPDSGGITLYDLAVFMKKAGCVDALNLDGGGSAGFMTKRPGDKVPLFRNIPGDGYERNISSAILIVKDSQKKKNLEASAEESKAKSIGSLPSENMANRDTYLDKTLLGRYMYTRNNQKPSGVFNIESNAYLFKEGKGVSSAIRIGEIEYEFRKGIYIGASDPNAGSVLFGYCGADDDGKNLIFALQKGNWLLNIGPNYISDYISYERTGNTSGEMEDWSTTQESHLPWYAFRHRIKGVYIADGVTSIGSRFLYMPKGIVKVSTETPFNELRYIRLPDSLRSIGDYAFYNKPLLRDVELPSHGVSIGIDAFDRGVGFSVRP